MWDSDRLHISGELAVLDREWGEVFEYPNREVEDPRDDLSLA